MRKLPARLGVCLAASLVSPAAGPAKTADRAVIARIIDEGTNRSHVMPTVQYLTDMIGPRLTNSPGARKAEAWAHATLRGWGLSNSRLEPFAFGRGWWVERSSVDMLAPRAIRLTAIPIAWTPSTNGTVAAPIIVAPMKTAADFAAWRGKLAGRIVLVSAPDAAGPAIPFSRQTPEDLAKLDAEKETVPDPARLPALLARANFPRARDAFLAAEGAVALATMSRLDGKLVLGEGSGFAVGDTPKLPAVEIAAEDYRRLVRLAAMGATPTLAIDTRVHYEDRDTNAYNVLADIPGRDATAGYVLAGAHLDSWVAADGAADDGAGVAVVMEAARILARMPRPRRTIRFALWGAEEQGVLGTMAYADRYLATRGSPTDPIAIGPTRFTEWLNRWPVVPKPGWHDLVAAFDIDNGSGKVRGLLVGRNTGAQPIVRAWLAPFASMGADFVGRGNGANFLASIGIPSFELVQDWLDYGRVHHTSIDTFDHLEPTDMRQAATVLAGLLWNAANADPVLPRVPMPSR